MRYGKLRVGSSVAGRLREGRPVRFRSRRLAAAEIALIQGAPQHIVLERFKLAAIAVVAGTDLDLRWPTKRALGVVLIPAPNRHQRDGKFLGDQRVGNEVLNVSHLGSFLLEPGTLTPIFTPLLGAKKGS